MLLSGAATSVRGRFAGRQNEEARHGLSVVGETDKLYQESKSSENSVGIIAEGVTSEASYAAGRKIIETKIVMLYEGGLMLDDGRKIAIGDTFDFEGASETLGCVNVDCGIVGFESGKRVRF